MVRSKFILVIGDLFAIGLITVIGFATHGETELSLLPRMAATFFPLVIAWFLLAPGFGLFHNEVIHQARQLWRPALIAFFAASMAAVLRGFMLNAPVIPIFAVVLGGAFALGMVAWRALYFLLDRKICGA
jgi:hypothetical protein